MIFHLAQINVAKNDRKDHAGKLGEMDFSMAINQDLHFYEAYRKSEQ
jgi:hypothetical protein